jgi:hypothetical protein
VLDAAPAGTRGLSLTPRRAGVLRSVADELTAER